MNELIVAKRHGSHRVGVRTVVVATGDAHVAEIAGNLAREGRESDGVHQPMSLHFVLDEIDLPRLQQFFEQQGGEKAVVAHRELLGNGPCAMFIKKFAVTDGWPQKWLDSFSIPESRIEFFTRRSPTRRLL